MSNKSELISEITALNNKISILERLKSEHDADICSEKKLSDESTPGFTSLFDLDEIQSIQDNLADATGLASIITKPDGTPITKPSNFCRLCKDIIRSTPIGLENCMKSDAIIGRPNPDGPIFQQCLSGGLWDAGASIFAGEKHVANWLVGQARDSRVSDEHLLTYADEIGSDRDEFKRALDEVPDMSEEQFRRLSLTLHIFASLMSRQAYQNLQHNIIINQLRQTERALKTSEAKYRVLVENNSDLILTFDTSKKATYANPSYYNLFGLTGKNIIGKNFMHLVHEDDCPTVDKKIKELLSPPYEVQTEIRCKTRYGWHWLAWSGVALRNETGQITSLLAVGRDIDDKRTYEAERESLIKRLEQQNNNLENFTRTVSHDLKSPLITINGFLELINKGLEQIGHHDLSTYISYVTSATKSMQNLVDELQVLSRIAQDQPKPKLVDFGDVVREAVDLVHGRLKEAKARVEISPDLPSIMGNRVLLKQLVQNLIDNAAKFGKAGQNLIIKVGVRTEGDQQVFYVQDNGRGIPPAKNDYIFQIFQKLDPKSDGTGVGLALVKKIVDAHGGRIWVESEGEGHGATFLFTLKEDTH